MKFDPMRSDRNVRSPRATFLNHARLVIVAIAATGSIAAVNVLAQWLPVITPRWLIRGASVAFLWTLLCAYTLAALAVVIGGLCSLLALARTWRRHDLGALARPLRLALLASSCLVGLLAMELGSSIKIRRSTRLPTLPTRFAPPPPRFAQGVATSAADRGIYIVVVGESSARGEPYDPWLSVGQLVAWQLERVFPGRQIEVDIRAHGGLVLEQAVLCLRDLERRPDAMIVFAGHNEFQTRFGWSRNVAHYVEEGPHSPLALLELARATSSTYKLILDSLDRYYGQAPPLPRITRELVDHPICTPKEYAFLRDDFRNRLDALADYCTRIGCLPILIVPGSNDGSFEPNRSVLAASTPARERAAFASQFQAIRATEAENAAAAIAAYRRLVEQHPEFAETHYRLGRLLAASGAWDEATNHFVLARDLDGFPLRCPSDFQEIYRAVARRYHTVLIDGPEVLSRASPHGVLDEHLYHDAHHPGILGIVALADDLLEQLERRRAFGWPEKEPAPRIEPGACARHFELDSRKWADVCDRTALFYARTAYIRHEPSARRDVADRYHRAALDFAAGRVPPASELADMAIPRSIVEPALAAGSGHADRQ
jgi:hypothetical protein